jgi:hypothetical protein
MQGYVCTITGTVGGDTTVAIPLKHVVAHWVGNEDETDGYNPAITWSGGTATYGTAPTSSKKHRLFAIGFD